MRYKPYPYPIPSVSEETKKRVERTHLSKKEELKLLIEQLRDEVKENKNDIRYAVRCEDYAEAAHLTSVNFCLDYVINHLKDIIKTKKGNKS